MDHALFNTADEVMDFKENTVANDHALVDTLVAKVKSTLPDPSFNGSVGLTPNEGKNQELMNLYLQFYLYMMH